MLNPNITKESGTYWLNWTPDPTAEGYAFVTPTGKSRTFDPALARTKLGKNLTEPLAAGVSVLDVTQRPLEVATYPSSAPPPPPPPPGDPGMPDRSLAAWDALLPGLTVKTVRTSSEWATAWAGLAGGTLIDVVSPIGIPGLYSKRRFSSQAAVRFCDGVTLTDRSYLEGDKLAVWGGTAKDVASHGLTTTNCGAVRWWGLTVDGCDGHGYLAHSNVGPNTGLDIDAEITRNGLAWVRDPNTPLDPHRQKGTGLQVYYIGANDVGNAGTSGKFSFRAHDCAAGAGQIGNDLHHFDLWVDAKNLTCDVNKIPAGPGGERQVAGSPLSFWGNPHDGVVHYLNADNVSRACEPAASFSNVVVKYARATNVRLGNTHAAAYPAKSGLTYEDCLP